MRKLEAMIMVKELIEPSLIEPSLQGFSVTFSKVQNVYLQ